MSRWVLIGIIVGFAGCDGEPLTCKNGGIVTTPAGDRLLVQCSEDVANIPIECAVKAMGEYLCNEYHADAMFCATFPGVCASN